MEKSKGLPLKKILRGLLQLREEDVLCDIQLEAEGKRLSVHRAVLASVSPYFKVLFTGAFKESEQNVIELKEVTFEGLRTIVDCCYGAALKLDTENLSQVLAAASLFQITDIYDQCESFMKTVDLDENNCFIILRLAERYNFKNLASDVNDYILENFATIRHQSDFKNLRKEALVQYLSQDELNTRSNEAEVLYAINDWLNQDEGRMQYAEEMIQYVRFFSINTGKLLEIAKMDLIDDRKICRALVRNALEYQYNTFAQPLTINEMQNRPRGKQGLIVILGGQGKEWISDTPNKVYKHLLWSDRVRQTSVEVMREEFVRHSVLMTQLNNILFLFAVKVVNGSRFLKPASFRYDVSNDQWLDIADEMYPPPVVGSSLGHIGDEIFLIGGMYIYPFSSYCLDNDFTDQVSKYTISTNSWEELPGIPTETFASAATGYSLNSCVYVSGGYTQDMDEVLDLFWAYDTKANLWLRKPPINHARGDHLMEAVGDKIYVLGGQNHCRPVHQIEKYDIVSEQWSDIVDQTLDRIDSFSLVSDTNIFVLGGAKRNKDYRPTKAIRYLDTKTERLMLYKASLPEPVTAHVAALVTFPNKN